MKSHRTYIVPTGFGIAFGAVALVLLVMAIGYANNLLYFFVFLLISMALTGMWLTNKNVDSVQISSLSCSNLFAGEDNEISVNIQNKNLIRPIWDIEISFIEKKQKSEVLNIEEVKIENKYFLQWKPEHRGILVIPRLLIESRFPYKMLRAWKYYDQKNEQVVYPQRKGIERIPQLSGDQSENELHAKAQDQGLFRDYREFQKSDSPRRIDWKRSLKHQKHLVKNFENSGEKKIKLDWELTKFSNNFEERISQLAFWIDLCQQKNEIYSLKIKEFETEFSNLPNHYKNCMQKLALLKMEDVV